MLVVKKEKKAKEISLKNYLNDGTRGTIPSVFYEHYIWNVPSFFLAISQQNFSKENNYKIFL